MLLLTGGAGYIGAHTALELMSQGDDIVILDNFSGSKPAVLDVLRRLTGRDIISCRADITDKSAIDALFDRYPIDAVIHFAALKAVAESVSEPLRYYHNNVFGTLTMLESMAEHGIKRLIFSSTAALYGEDNASPYNEEMPVSRCTNPYGQTKLVVENMIRDLCASDQAWRVVILRYFNAVGAHESGELGEDPSGTPANLVPAIAQVAVGRMNELLIYGDNYATPDGTCLRDYIHVCDLAKGHTAALNRLLDETCGCETYNLGTGRPISVIEMLKTFENISGKTIPHRIAPRRPGDLAVAYADSRKANRQMGWKAELSLDRIVEDVWRWQKKYPNGL